MISQDDWLRHWAELNEHLEEVRPIFDDFCRRHGFAYVNRQALGRYPRIRISRERLTSIYFDLAMELDAQGHRFKRFRRDLPYVLGAGASTVEERASMRIRFQAGFACFRQKPFYEVGAVLNQELERYLPILEAWDRQYLKEIGAQVRLGG